MVEHPPSTQLLPLHATDRRLDVAFAAIGDAPADVLLHCIHDAGVSLDLPPTLAGRLPDARWIPKGQHPLSFAAPSDHLLLHQTWLAACHGPDRVARTTVRTVAPLHGDRGEVLAGPGTFALTLIDLVGVEGIDAVVVLLEATAEDPVASAASSLPPPRGTESFRLRLDLDGRIIGGTATAASLLGRPLGDLLGTEVLPLIHPDDLPAATDVWNDVLARPEQSQTVRLRLLHGDGSWRWFTDTAWNDLDDPDAPGVMSEFHDIGDLVAAEQALRASELGFRTLAESLPVGVAVLDEDGQIHFANERLVTLILELGLGGPGSPGPVPEPAGPEFRTTWSELLVPDFAEAVADLVRPTEGADDALVSRQLEVLGLDGRSVHLLLHALTVVGDGGRNVIVSVQDVSAEVTTGQAHNRLVQTVDMVGDAVVVCEVEGPITYLNPAATAVFGADALGRSIFDLMDPGPRRFTDEVIIPEIVQLRSWTGDVPTTVVDGDERIFATTVIPVHGPVGGDVHVGIIMRDVTADRAHERELARLARHDTLTDLPNRFALMELIEARCSDGDPDEDVAVFFIDLDNLKIVNDGLGHSAGDRLLVAVAEELRKAADDDPVARFGGDEFVVVATGVGPADALDHAERFLAAVERATVAGVASRVSASIGVATSPRRTATAEALIGGADAAMYVAKRAGRARCAVFDEALRRQASARFALEERLRAAIDDDELEIHLQPIISNETGTITGVESLCRLPGSSPAEFIPVAEESGLIVDLGAAVLRRSLEAGHRLHVAAPGMEELRVGVNVSAHELAQPLFAERTLAIIAESSVPPELVVLELTESALIDPSDEVTATLYRLRDAGVTLALDDFGAGYSGLSYLRRYPIDILKLDISYTQAIATDAETQVIVESLVDMAARLGRHVVAEGVETTEQLARVQELGIRWAQGYLIGRPQPVEALLASGMRPAEPLTSA